MTAINPKTAQSLKKLSPTSTALTGCLPKQHSGSKKGALVELFGRIGLNVYIGSDAEAHGCLTFHTAHIKILAFAKSGQETPQVSAGIKENTEKEPDDLPF